VKADVAGDASGVAKALSADADAAKTDVATEMKTIETEVSNFKTDAMTDIEKAHAAASLAVHHIDASGIVSHELTKAKSLLAHILAYIEAHI
jgi:transcriptional regulator